jgi:hypothetical protein
MGKEEKSGWQVFKEGFMPADARADAQVRQNRAQYGNQLEKDMKESPEERAKKLREGFMRKFKY